MTTQAFPYDEVFRAVEQQVLALGSQGLAAHTVSQHLNNFKTFSTSSFSDDEVFWKLVLVAFYSGFRAATVTNKLDVIKRHFPDWQTVARYSEADIQCILNDGGLDVSPHQLMDVDRKGLTSRLAVLAICAAN